MTTYINLEETDSNLKNSLSEEKSSTTIPTLLTNTIIQTPISISANSDKREEEEEESDDDEDQEQFDRISGILSALIHEANEAINTTPSSLSFNIPSEVDTLFENTTVIKDLTTTSKMNSNHLSINTNFENNITSNMTSNDRSRPSRLPRPKKLSIESIYQPLRRSSSNSSYTPTVSSSTSSTSDDYDIYQDEDALFSPVSTDLTTPMSRTISPLLFDKSTLIQLLRQEKINNEVERMETHDIFNDNLDDHIDDDNDDDDDDALLSPSDSLMASFERLDSSLAIVDSLSRDLASCRRRARSVSTLSDTMVMKNETLDNTNMDQSKNNETGYFDGWIIVLILPLLYIPCMLLNALWNELIVVATVESTTPLSYLSTKASMFVYESSFPSTELATPTAGLAVFLLSMSILHLLTMGSRNQEHGHRHVISSMDRSKYKMIRRSSLPMDPPFISLQPSINPHLRTSSSYT